MEAKVDGRQPPGAVPAWRPRLLDEPGIMLALTRELLRGIRPEQRDAAVLDALGALETIHRRYRIHRPAWLEEARRRVERP